MNTPSDRQLIGQVLVHKDREAFGVLVRRYQSMIRGMLRKLTGGDEALADDIAQETFVVAFVKLATFRGEARFSTWIYRIAYRKFLEQKRKLKELPLTHDRQPVADDKTENSKNASSSLRVDMDRALLVLSEAERAAIVLCYFQDLSHTEAAQILDVPIGTLKTHVLRGKQQLRSRLEAWQGVA